MILRYFFRGLLVTVPVVATCYVLWFVFVTLDGLVDSEKWFGRVIPGIGVAVVLVLITFVGFITSTFLTKWVVTLMDKFFQQMPGAKLIYTAIKDMMEALVGEKKRFDRPVRVRLAESGPEVFGFITNEKIAWEGLEDRVAVYFPQSYNFAGQVLLFPRDRVHSIDAESSEVMKFIVSGGVS
ncbi:MAG: DUF502 domain-containing protein [Planctomycetota bacterium]|jgi:uncharacterized membrane protein